MPDEDDPKRYYYYASERGCLRDPDSVDEIGVGQMKYGIQCCTGGWFLVYWYEGKPALIPYSNGADEGVRLVTFDTEEEAKANLLNVEKLVGVTGRYEVISL